MQELTLQEKVNQYREMIKDNNNSIAEMEKALRSLKTRREILKETLDIYIGELKK